MSNGIHLDEWSQLPDERPVADRQSLGVGLVVLLLSFSRGRIERGDERREVAGGNCAMKVSTS
jgi:hypothetical protein